MITAVIPVRAGSQRVTNKNLRPFAGSSLLEICINKLKQTNVDNIVVNSNSPEMISLAKQYGVDTHRRPDELGSSATRPNDLAAYIAEVTKGDTILYVHCTSPLISVETIQHFLTLEEYLDVHDSVNSASLIKKHMWSEGYALNYDPARRPNTQDLPDIYALNYALNLIKRSDMKNYRDFIGRNPLLQEISEKEAIDIDNIQDFELAEIIYNKQYETTGKA
jgi:CMP-N-acetylneuraminic acid synthetase